MEIVNCSDSLNIRDAAEDSKDTPLPNQIVSSKPLTDSTLEDETSENKLFHTVFGGLISSDDDYDDSDNDAAASESGNQNDRQRLEFKAVRLRPGWFKNCILSSEEESKEGHAATLLEPLSDLSSASLVELKCCADHYFYRGIAYGVVIACAKEALKRLTDDDKKTCHKEWNDILARAHFANGSLNEALKYAQICLSCDTGHDVSAHLLFARISMKIGDFVASIEGYQYVLKNLPMINPDVWCNLAECYEKLGTVYKELAWGAYQQADWRCIVALRSANSYSADRLKTLHSKIKIRINDLALGEYSEHSMKATSPVIGHGDDAFWDPRPISELSSKELAESKVSFENHFLIYRD